LPAEVGIRDFHVTGVQTCALPIFVRRVDIGLMMLVVMKLERLGRHIGLKRIVGIRKFRELEGGHGGLSVLGGWNYVPNAYRLGKIGRASCREGVEVLRLGVDGGQG